MANKLLLLTVILFAGFGCGMIDRARKAAAEPDTNTTKIDVNSNKSLTDTAVDSAVGEKKIGIVECDEALDMLTAQANDPDDNFVTKAVKKTAINTFRDRVKKSLEESKTDKKEVAKFCREFKDNLKESASEENTNTKQ
ncbi:MAG: hypothetical protein ABI646_11275 [Acidobacteriota bacterium]